MREQTVALALCGERLPGVRPGAADLDRPVGQPGHLVADLHRNHRRVAGVRGLEAQLRRFRVIAQRDRHRRRLLGRVARRIAPDHGQAKLTRRGHLHGEARDPIAGLLAVRAAATGHRAQRVGRGVDRRAVALGRVAPGELKVVAIAPRVAAEDADVDTLGRRVVDAHRDRRRARRHARAVQRLHDQLLRPLEEPLCGVDGDRPRRVVGARDRGREGALRGERARPRVLSALVFADERAREPHAGVVGRDVVERLALAGDPVAARQRRVLDDVHGARRLVVDDGGLRVIGGEVVGGTRRAPVAAVTADAHHALDDPRRARHLLAVGPRLISCGLRRVCPLGTVVVGAHVLDRSDRGAVALAHNCSA